MKFKYELKNNFYKMYNEANYLVGYKKHFLNNKKTKIKGFIDEFLLYFLISIIFIIVGLKFDISMVLIILFSIVSILCLVVIIHYFICYNNYKNSNHKGVITIDENGIKDDSDISLSFYWENIELIGITSNTLIIVVNQPFVIILEPNNKIINEILKYKAVKVINS